MTKGQRTMTDYKLVPFEPTLEMIEAAEEAHMPFGDMDLAIRMAILAAPAVQVEPVAWVTADTVDGQAVNGMPRRIWWENNEGVGMPIYTAPQPAAQQPDISQLLELLSHARCNTCDGSGGLYDNHGHPHQCQWCHDRSTALATHRKQGGEA